MFATEVKPKRIRCSEIWGGIRNTDLDVSTSVVTASLYAGASDGVTGGDIYYFSVCEKDTITRIALADVLGHGNDVSEMSQWIYHALAARMNAVDSNGILADLNSVASESAYKGFTTAVVLSFRADNSKLYFSDAGHPPVWVRRRKEGTWRALGGGLRAKRTNLPLGMFPDTAYEQEEIQLDSGDRLFVYTDGLTEALSSEGELFGNDRLLAVLEESAGKSLFDVKQAVLRAARSHAGGSLGQDDVTLMVVEVQ